MAEVINLIDYKIETKRQKYFEPWKKRFRKDFEYFTRLSDLSDANLFVLGRKDFGSEEALREIVMATLSIGPVSKYPFLAVHEKIKIDGTVGKLSEQVFFEIVRRLGWVVDYPCFRYSIPVIIKSFEKGAEFSLRTVPVFSEKFAEKYGFNVLDPKLCNKILDDKFNEALYLFEKKLKEGPRKK
jgi:hypothetical protein